MMYQRITCVKQYDDRLTKKYIATL